MKYKLKASSLPEDEAKKRVKKKNIDDIPVHGLHGKAPNTASPRSKRSVRESSIL